MDFPQNYHGDKARFAQEYAALLGRFAGFDPLAGMGDKNGMGELRQQWQQFRSLLNADNIEGLRYALEPPGQMTEEIWARIKTHWEQVWQGMTQFTAAFEQYDLKNPNKQVRDQAITNLTAGLQTDLDMKKWELAELCHQMDDHMEVLVSGDETIKKTQDGIERYQEQRRQYYDQQDKFGDIPTVEQLEGGGERKVVANTLDYLSVTDYKTQVLDRYEQIQTQYNTLVQQMQQAQQEGLLDNRKPLEEQIARVRQARTMAEEELKDLQKIYEEQQKQLNVEQQALDLQIGEYNELATWFGDKTKVSQFQEKMDTLRKQREDRKKVVMDELGKDLRETKQKLDDLENTKKQEIEKRRQPLIDLRKQKYDEITQLQSEEAKEERKKKFTQKYEEQIAELDHRIEEENRRVAEEQKKADQQHLDEIGRQQKLIGDYEKQAQQELEDRRAAKQNEIDEAQKLIDEMMKDRRALEQQVADEELRLKTLNDELTAEAEKQKQQQEAMQVRSQEQVKAMNALTENAAKIDGTLEQYLNSTKAESAQGFKSSDWRKRLALGIQQYITNSDTYSAMLELEARFNRETARYFEKNEGNEAVLRNADLNAIFQDYSGERDELYSQMNGSTEKKEEQFNHAFVSFYSMLRSIDPMVELYQDVDVDAHLKGKAPYDNPFRPKSTANTEMKKRVNALKSLQDMADLIADLKENARQMMMGPRVVELEKKVAAELHCKPNEAADIIRQKQANKESLKGNQWNLARWLDQYATVGEEIRKKQAVGNALKVLTGDLMIQNWSAAQKELQVKMLQTQLEKKKNALKATQMPAGARELQEKIDRLKQEKNTMEPIVTQEHQNALTKLNQLQKAPAERIVNLKAAELGIKREQLEANMRDVESLKEFIDGENEIRQRVQKLKEERTGLKTQLDQVVQDVNNEYTGLSKDLNTKYTDLKAKLDQASPEGAGPIWDAEFKKCTQEISETVEANAERQKRHRELKKELGAPDPSKNLALGWKKTPTVTAHKTALESIKAKLDSCGEKLKGLQKLEKEVDLAAQREEHLKKLVTVKNGHEKFINSVTTFKNTFNGVVQEQAKIAGWKTSGAKKNELLAETRNKLRAGIAHFAETASVGQRADHHNKPEFAGLLQSLADFGDDSKVQLNTPAEIKTALENIRTKANTYITAKKKQWFHWVPTPQRKIRLAYAQRVVDFCSEGMRQLAETERKMSDVQTTVNNVQTEQRFTETENISDFYRQHILEPTQRNPKAQMVIQNRQTFENELEDIRKEQAIEDQKVAEAKEKYEKEFKEKRENLIKEAKKRPVNKNSKPIKLTNDEKLLLKIWGTEKEYKIQDVDKRHKEQNLRRQTRINVIKEKQQQNVGKEYVFSFDNPEMHTKQWENDMAAAFGLKFTVDGFSQKLTAQVRNFDTEVKDFDAKTMELDTKMKPLVDQAKQVIEKAKPVNAQPKPVEQPKPAEQPKPTNVQPKQHVSLQKLDDRLRESLNPQQPAQQQPQIEAPVIQPKQLGQQVPGVPGAH